MKSKEKSKAVSIIAIIIGITLVAKLIGFIRDAVIGSTFGTSIESDAYFIGLSITTIIFMSLGTAISTAVIPISVRLKSSTDKNKALSSILNLTLIISGIITLICFLFTPQIVQVFAGGFSGEKLDLTIKLTQIMIPTVFFISIAYLFVGLLQANEHYFLPSIISFPYNLIAIIYLFVGVKTYGITGLAVVTTIGWFLQMLIQVPKVYQVSGFKYGFKLDLKNSFVKEYFIGLLPITLIAATQQITYLSDNTFASHLGDGKVTALYYSNMLFLAIVTTAVYGITAVMFPKFNKKYVEVDKRSFFTSINLVMKGIILLLVPISVGLALVSEDIISLILMRGEFTQADVKTTSMLLIGYASYMVAFGIWDVLNKVYYTMGNKKLPMVVSGIIIVSNHILNILCVKAFDLIGIPIATSISFYIGIIVSLLFFKINEGNLDFEEIIITSIKTLVSVFVMAFLIKGFNYFFQIEIMLLRIIVDVGIGMIVYLLTLLILREKTIYEFINTFKIKRIN